MNLSQRIEAFKKLGEFIKSDSENQIPYELIRNKNQWFTKSNVKLALDTISNKMLDERKLHSWIANYKLPDINKKVAVILAGNIPAVGFHDLLCILIVGYKAQIKLSSKDPIIIPFLLYKLVEIEPRFYDQFEIVDSLSKFDAIIATGSDNSSVYFNHYFEKYPNIIRKNRTSIGVVYKDTSDVVLRKFAIDIFQFFGLGCRNISKIYIEKGFQREHLMKIWHENKELVLHSKYKNNFDYNYTLMLLNQDDFLMNGALLLKRDKSLHSRIATLHYEEFENIEMLDEIINKNIESIQCIVSSKKINGLEVVEPGHAQEPHLDQYADDIDTIQFLIDL